MLSDLTPSVRNGCAPTDTLNPDLRVEYEHLREELERLLAAPVKDFAQD